MRVLFLLLLCLSGVIAQTGFTKVEYIETFIVDSISISGNEKTKDYVILRELTFSKGDTVDYKTLEYSSERVFSLGIFNRVEIYPRSLKGTNIIQIEVMESWSIYPIPIFEINNGDLKDASYGLSLYYKNFRGRNETINFQFTLGYDPSLSLSYYNPLIEEKNELSSTVNFSYKNASNINREAELAYGKDFNFKQISGQFMVSKRFGSYTKVGALAGYLSILPPDDLPVGFTASGEVKDNYPFSGLVFTYDSRDLINFPKSGYFLQTEFVHYGLGGNVDYNFIKADFRDYHKITDGLVGKWRTVARHTFGSKVPFYNYSFLGYDEYIRGNSGKKREGNNYLVFNTEIRYPIISEWNLSLDLPLLPVSLTSARIGIFVHGFADSGVSFNNNSKVSIRDFDTGYGLGLTVLILPHNSFRIEYGLNEKNKGEVLFGTGISF